MTHPILYYFICGGASMNKTTTISLRVSKEELDKLKLAARLESYSSYSEFIRRTALLEATRIISQAPNNTRGESIKNEK